MTQWVEQEITKVREGFASAGAVMRHAADEVTRQQAQIAEVHAVQAQGDLGNAESGGGGVTVTYDELGAVVSSNSEGGVYQEDATPATQQASTGEIAEAVAKQLAISGQQAILSRLRS